MFCMYIQFQASKRLGIDKRNIILYALSILYILSAATAVLDMTRFMVTEVSETYIYNRSKFSVYTSQVITSGTSPLLYRLIYASSIIEALCDFISQAILVCTKPLSISISCCTHPNFPKIYRCWVVWSHDIRVIIIPSILSLLFLGQSIRSCISIF